jgi:hypothetical protein
MRKESIMRVGILFISLLLMVTPVFSAQMLYISHPMDVTDQQTIDRDVRPLTICKQLLVSRSSSDSSILSFLTSTIHTSYEDVEKTTEITFGLNNEIDVDNDENTGIDGKDIQVNYVLLPYLTLDPEFCIGLVFSVTIERIADEIKDSPFSLTAELGDNLMHLGYETLGTMNSEIPKKTTISSTLYLSLEDSRVGFSFSMNPEYETTQGQHTLSLHAKIHDEDIQRSFTFTYTPAIDSQITIEQTENPSEWEYSITRDIQTETVLTVSIEKTENNDEKTTTLTITPLPSSTIFRLTLTPFSSEGGSIHYESSSMYSASILVETEDLGLCKYALIKNSPRSIDAQWMPSKENGFYHIEMDSDGTDIFLLNTLQNPTINLSLNNMGTVNMTAYWNLTNPGTFQVIKEPSLQIDLDILFEEWEARLNAEPVAENIFLAWETNITGFLTLDTEWQPLSTLDLVVKGPSLGINTTGESFKADDFHIEWTVWPLSAFNVSKTGSVSFLSLSIDVFIQNNWYHIWPLFQ